MKETLLDRVKEAKRDHEVAQVIYYNNGAVRTEDNKFAKKSEKIYDDAELEMLMEDFCKSTAIYSRMYEFDTMEVCLLLGLIYDVKDVDENKRIKEGAQPLNNIVRYYDVEFNSYSDGQKTNEYEYGYSQVTHQGYIHYDKLVKAFANSGIEFTGPKTFNEFKEAIQSGEKFDISLIAELNNKKEHTKTLSR